MRVLQFRQQCDLALKTLDGDRSRHLRRQNLHGDGSAEARVSRNEHARHSATVKLALNDEVFADRSVQLVAKVHGCHA